MSGQIQDRLAQSYALDRLWRETMGLPPGDTKEQPLRGVVAVLEAAGTPYAVIGGVAMQMLSKQPRTTLDIDVAVRTFAEIPRDGLVKAGFVHEGRQAHSDNWRAPGDAPLAHRIAVQFSAQDVGIDVAVSRARAIDVGGFQLRLASPADMLVLKLAAAEEPSQRASKRRQDLLDVVTLAEEYPRVAAHLPDLQLRVDRLTKKLLTLGRDRGPER
jgi:hypothetical protein